ncbi:MAG: NERD domain-containing protein [Saccharospirillum sp.]|uniref:nuclease-related domain-containing protein n=2 Tax=Saccharospirillum sp. TaxID=2033801 RepID=UPI00329A67DC
MEIVSSVWASIIETGYLIPGFLAFIFLITFFQSSWFKGKAGEGAVAYLLSRLPKDDYVTLNDVTIPTQDGTTQVDHIVVSIYGVFVVETKNMKGWIFGSVNQRQWTQKIYRHSSKFQNPLHQNYKHVKVLESSLGLPPEITHSLVLFVGDSTFKTQMPSNVTTARAGVRFIQSFETKVLDHDQVTDLVTNISNLRLQKSRATNKAHIRHIESIIEEKTFGKNCPHCGADMVLRESKKGHNAGDAFWGCSRYPKCRGTRGASALNLQ